MEVIIIIGFLKKKYINKLYTNDIELANNSKIKLIK